MTEAAFQAASAALSGFQAASGQVALADEDQLNAKVLATANLLPVSGGYRPRGASAEAGGGGGVGRWAGVTPAGHRVLLQVDASASPGGAATVTLKCDDALLANTLLDVVKKGLSA